MAEVALSCLDPKNAVMHGKIVRPSLLVAIDIVHEYTEHRELKRPAKFWEIVRTGVVKYNVAGNRERIKEIVAMFAPLLGAMGIQAQIKKGMWGGQKER